MPFTTTRAASPRPALTLRAGGRGTLVHNIAFCLHCLGEFEAAKAYYEQSLELFTRINVPTQMRRHRWSRHGG